MEIKNDIKWLKDHRFVTEVGTPDELDSKDKLRKYVAQVHVASQLNDNIDEGSDVSSTDTFVKDITKDITAADVDA